MKKSILVCFALANFFVIRGHAQLSVVEGGGLGMTPLQLIQSILVGNGVTVSSATFNGSSTLITSAQIGSFATAGGATTQLGFSGGLMITSGSCATAIGPNGIGSAGVTTGTGSDPDLLALSGQPVFDKGILEFDFIPIADTLRFRYVFGSEEFDEYCNSSFNDIFGFFISGPGISGPFTNNAINIALMPGGSQFVTINNVCNTPGSSWSNAGGIYYQYDRLTNVYTAMVVVQACQTYHLKIAIGDAGDGAFDSGVFLQENSFSTNGLSYNTSYTSNVDTVAVEGCNNAIISFILNDPAGDTMVINYYVGGTAFEGTDYVPVPDSLIILPGQDSVAFIIYPISDGIGETMESVIISYLNTICGSLDTILIWIKDYDSIQTSITPDVFICDGSNATVSVTATGGYPPLTYIWDPGGQTTSGITVNPAVPTEYVVTVSDECNFEVYDTVMVSISNLSSVVSNVDSVTCNGYTDGSISITASYGLQPYSYIWSTSDTSAIIDNMGAGTYFVTVTDDIGCSVTNAVIINDPPAITITVTSTNEHCLNSCDGEAEVTVDGLQIPPYSYLWSNNQTTAIAAGLCAGDYFVTVTYSPNNCTVTGATNVATNTFLEASFITDPFIPQGYVPFNITFTFDGYLNGNGVLTYIWDFGDGSDTTGIGPHSHTYTSMGTYTVTLTINSGNPDNCQDVYQFDVVVVQPASLVVPNVFTPNGDGHNDSWAIVSEGLQIMNIQIYNRWGKKVFDYSTSSGFPSNIDTGTPVWDGSNKGGPRCASGTYFYVLEAKGYDGQEFNLNGIIQLLE